MTQGSVGQQTTRIEVLRAHGEGKPLFVFPDVYGELQSYKDMANRLGGHRPVYGFRHIGLDNECDPVRQVSRAAQLYTADLRRVEPRGPYYLFGYGFGGAVAFEVARELDSQGQSVGLVIMAESATASYPQAAPLVKRARVHAGRLLQDSKRASTRYLRERIDAFSSRVAQRFGLDPHDIRKGAMPKQTRRVRAALHEAYLYYQPSPQCVDVLFLTGETPRHDATMIVQDPLLGWGAALRGRISQCTIPGSYTTLFAPENIGVLAERIRSALAAAERRCDDALPAIKSAAS